MTLLLGVLLGVVSSLVAWLLVAQAIRPRMAISKEISRRVAPPGHGSEFVYRVKIANRNRRRVAVDVRIDCALAFTHVFRDRPSNVNSYDIPVVEHELVRLGGRDGRVLWIYLHEAEALAKRLPEDLSERLVAGTVRLEELLRLPDARLRIFVRCSDSFSGARRYFEQDFASGSVAVGLYEKGGSLAISRSRGDAIRELDELAAAT